MKLQRTARIHLETNILCDIPQYLKKKDQLQHKHQLSSGPKKIAVIPQKSRINMEDSISTLTSYRCYPSNLDVTIGADRLSYSTLLSLRVVKINTATLNECSISCSDLRLICMNQISFIPSFSVRKNGFIAIFHIRVC